jgi:hypothetical protein
VDYLSACVQPIIARAASLGFDASVDWDLNVIKAQGQNA